MARPVRPPRPLGPTLTASLALHLSVLILLLVTIGRQPRYHEPEPPADFAMVFEGHSPERSSGVNPDLNKPLRPGSPPPGVTVPPVPAVPPAPAVPPPVAFLPPPPPPPPPAPAEASAKPQPAVPPLPEAPASPAVPAPEQAPLAMVIPRPPPLPAIPSPPLTPRATPARPERRPERAPAFPTPLNFSFGLPGATGPRIAALSRAPAMPAQPGRPGSINLSFGPIEGGSLSPSASVQMEGVAVSTDWLNLVSAWWQRHSYYPPQAGMNGEEGDVTLHMRVNHDGRVEGLELVEKSGSQWLDLGALSTFRDARLPPLPPDMPEAQIPFQVTVHYIIIR